MACWGWRVVAVAAAPAPLAPVFAEQAVVFVSLAIVFAVSGVSGKGTAVSFLAALPSCPGHSPVGQLVVVVD